MTTSAEGADTSWIKGSTTTILPFFNLRNRKNRMKRYFVWANVDFYQPINYFTKEGAFTTRVTVLEYNRLGFIIIYFPYLLLLVGVVVVIMQFQACVFLLLNVVNSQFFPVLIKLETKTIYYLCTILPSFYNMTECGQTTINE